MVELCSMASHVYPPGLGVVFHPEHVSSRGSESTNKSSKQTMLVSYFERRRRAGANTATLKLATVKVMSLKSHDEEQEKTAQKNSSNTRISKKREIYGNSSLHALKCLLTIIASRKQRSERTVLFVKETGPELPQLLIQFSVNVAGLGIGIVISNIRRIIYSTVPFCKPELVSIGLGLGLVSLSWAVNRLRVIIKFIGETSCESGDKEEEMMNHLDSILEDINYRLFMILMAVAMVLKVG